MPIQTVNPSTGAVIKTYQAMTDAVVEQKIEQAHASFLQWSRISFTERAKLMQNLANLLKKEKEAHAKIISDEMGKPITQSIAEVEKCAWVCEHYAKEAENYLKPELIKTEMTKSMVCYQPLGPIFAIMPWNFPYWQVFRFAAPNLMAGNVGLLSHAPISTGAAIAIEKLFHDAGFPQGIFTTLITEIPQAAKIIAHEKIAAVTLTGSARAGRAVGSEAAQNLKKCVLELGGSDPYIILEDVDIKSTVDICVGARLMNAGQSCISPKRLIVVEKIYQEFIKQAAEKVKQYIPGNPLDSNCNFGPMARSDLRNELHKQVQGSIAAGARCISGGKFAERAGFYYEPTLLVDIKPGMPAYAEELFGPVVCILAAKDETDALRIANDTCYGLGSAIFTKNIAHAEDMAIHHLRAGMCAINTSVASDPRLPFGGIKQSGFGRECASEGIREFMNTKTIFIK